MDGEAAPQEAVVGSSTDSRNITTTAILQPLQGAEAYPAPPKSPICSIQSYAEWLTGGRTRAQANPHTPDTRGLDQREASHTRHAAIAFCECCGPQVHPSTRERCGPPGKYISECSQVPTIYCQGFLHKKSIAREIPQKKSIVR